MFYKGIIFDLDNTLYSYDICHSKAIHAVIHHLHSQYNFTIDDIQSVYDKISTSTKYDLDTTASSHNKSIYFKQLLEKFNINLSMLPTIQTLYWSTFLENIELYEGVSEFIKWNRELGIKIGILTDYETEYQIQKLDKLDILPYINVIVTSEEVGIEKPSRHMFQTILNKMNLSPEEVIMIGDNYHKDIMGADNMNILSYWFTQTIKTQSITTLFSSWTDLHNEFTEIHTCLQQLSTLSKYVGQRIDLVQAGGGNSSVKYKDTLFIKSSGISMANITPSLGYSMINNKKLTHDLSNNAVQDVMKYTIMKTSKRPSIETYMHSILKKYTLHLHPIQVNKLLIRSDAKKIMNTLFSEALVIDYFTPGIKVCNEIKRIYNNENIIFLLNHGLIITTDYYNNIYKYLDYVIEKIDSYTEENQIKVDLTRYKYVSDITRFIYDKLEIQTAIYLCENQTINNFLKADQKTLKEPHTVPDELIYCGIKIAFINDLQEICDFYTTYQEIPKIIIINNRIYIINNSISKCREIEEVLLSKILVSYDNENKTFLSTDEICFLNNWDSEKYRQLL